MVWPFDGRFNKATPGPEWQDLPPSKGEDGILELFHIHPYAAGKAANSGGTDPDDGITKGLSELFQGIPGLTVTASPPYGPGNPENMQTPIVPGISEIGMVNPNSGAEGTGGQDPRILSPEKISQMYNTNIRENTARINTVLEERSYLDFYFPNSELGRRRVAFFENPDITETRSPKYAKRHVIARNEPVRMWVGAEARRVTIKFSYTLPHIAQFWALIGKEPEGFGAVTEKVDPSLPKGNTGSGKGDGLDRYRQHQTPWAGGRTSKVGGPGAKGAWKAFVAHQVGTFFGENPNADTAGRSSTKSGVFIDTTDILTFSNYSQVLGPRLYEELPVDGFKGKYATQMQKAPHSQWFETLLRTGWSINGKDLNSPYLIAAYYTLFVIDTIRASVVGDVLTTGPVGPPIVKFTHGVVFNGPSFIVKNFSVDYDKSAGYEVRTLCPRKVTFSLQLEEFRQTYGAQHGGISDPVQSAGQIIDLEYSDFGTNTDRTQRRPL